MKLPRKTFCFMLFIAMLGYFAPAYAEEPSADAKPRDLGPPLVDNLKDMTQLGKYAAWRDPKNKQVVLVGETCKAGYGLEFLVTTKERAYESVLVIEGKRHDKNEMSIFQLIHASLLKLGANSGHPAYYDQKTDKTVIATGDEIAIELRWKDKNGKTQTADARTWIRDMKTKKSPTVNWVFGGSQIVKDEEGHNRYLGDSGDFICVLNNPVAMLDLPILSGGAIESRLFEANSEAMPPEGTPVTIILKPKVKEKK
jgi:hypothetical protein